MKTIFTNNQKVIMCLCVIALLTYSTVDFSYGQTCQVGDVLSLGESCTLPDDVRFSVLQDGNGQYWQGSGNIIRQVIISDNRISVNGFVATPQDNGRWLIEQIPGGPVVPTFSPNVVADQTFTVGTAVNLMLPIATDGTAPYTYTLSPMPEGLSFDATTRVISGTPTTATPTTLVSYTARDATGKTASLTFTMTVMDATPADPADITFDPEQTTYRTGDVIPTLPSSGFWFPSRLSSGRYLFRNGFVTITLFAGGSFVYNGITYTSASGCTIVRNLVTSGSVSVPTGPQPNNPVATTLEVVSGDGQSALVNQQLASPLVVRVKDQNDDPMSGVSVAFSVTPSATVSPSSATTGTNGQAQTQLTLGSTAGTYTVTARASGITQSVTFTATATTPVPQPRATTLEVVSGDGQSALVNQQLASPLVVRVKDQNDDPMSGVSVAFSVTPSATVSPSSATTGTNGQAQTQLTLGSTAGTYTVTARASGITQSVTFTATATAPVLAFNPPTIGDQTFTVGTSVSLVLPVATGGTVPYTYTLSPIPAGLSFNPATRVLSGTPTTVGTTSATYTATDAANGSASLTFTIEVTEDSDVPADDQMYWIDSGTDKIQRADLDGTNIEDIVTTGLRTPSGIAVDTTADKVYWIDSGTDKIQRANLDGSNIQDIVTTGLRTPTDIALDLTGNKVYWIDSGTDTIQRANLDGSNIETLVTTGLRTPTGIAVDLKWGKVYWVDSGTDKVQRADLDGSNIQDIVTTGLRTPTGIAVDMTNDKVYWTDSGTDKIQRANLDGSNIEDIVTTGLRTPTDIALDPDGKVYWIDSGTDKIQRANLDGSNIEDIVTTGMRTPTGIALGIPQEVPTRPPGPPRPGGGAVDVNADGQVTVIDLAIVALFYGTRVSAGVDLPADVNDDGTVDINDLIAVAEAIDAAGNSSALSADDVEAVLEAIGEQVAEAPARFSSTDWVTRFPLRAGVAYRNVAAAFADAKLLATDDARLGKWMPMLKELLHLLTEMREIPDTTALLPNYPNPFNPETWIPYQLSKGTAVILTIHDVRGVLVRELTLGHQAAGVYESRARAAYWDGRNSVGEPVASGVYFYTLTAGEFTATRKMLIRK